MTNNCIISKYEQALIFVYKLLNSSDETTKIEVKKFLLEYDVASDLERVKGYLTNDE